MMIHGTLTQTLDDGTEVEAHYMIDTDKAELVQVGGEGTISAEDNEILMAMLAYAQASAGDEDEEE